MSNLDVTAIPLAFARQKTKFHHKGAQEARARFSSQTANASCGYTKQRHFGEGGGLHNLVCKRAAACGKELP